MIESSYLFNNIHQFIVITLISKINCSLISKKKKDFFSLFFNIPINIVIENII